MPQTQSSWQPVLRGFTVKENMLSMPRRYSTPRISNVFTVPLNDDFIFQTQDLRLHDDNITNVSYLIISCSRVGGIVVSIAAFQAVDPGSIPGRRNEANSTVLKMLHERLTNLFLLVYYYFYWLFLMI